MEAPSLIPFRITICGLTELSQHCAVGVSHVLSLLDSDTPRPTTLDQYEGIACELLNFDDVIDEYPGFHAPRQIHVERILAFGERLRRDAGKHLLVHCHAGISRSTASAAVMMAQFNPGRETEAFLKLLELRPHAWPNTRIVELADRLLKRDGALMTGLLAYRQEMLSRKPHLRDIIRNIGRGHELP
jgi:predicted protein tyrosine phosphatase